MATAAKFDADFSDFIGELNKVELKLADFDPSVKRAGEAARKLGDSLNGNRIAEQAQVALRAIQSIEGGVSALTKGEARKMGAIFDEATEKLSAMGRKVPADMAAVKASLDAVRASSDAVNKSAAEGAAGPSFASMFKEGLGIGAGMTAANAAVAAISAVKEQLSLAWQEGQKLSALGTAFTNLQGGALPAKQMLEDLRSSTRGLVTDLDLMQAANKASLLGLNEMGISTDKLASVAVKLGKAMGQDAAKSVDDLTTALARQSPMILDNLGIKVKLSDANAAYAASLGKSESALTEEERKLAFATAAMEAAEAKVKILGEQQLTLGERIQTMLVEATNARAEFGRWVNENPALVTAAEATAEAFGEVAEGASAIWREVKGLAKDIGGADGAWSLFTSTLEASLTPLRLVSLQLKTYADMLKTAADALAYLRGTDKIDPSDLKLPDAPEGSRFSAKPADRNLGFSQSGAGRARVDEALAAEEKRRAALIAENDAKLAGLEEKLRKDADQRRKAAHQKRLQDEKKYSDELAALSGKTAAEAGARLAEQVTKLSGKLTDSNAVEAFGKLWDAKKIAAVVAPGLVGGIDAAIKTLGSHPAIAKQAREASQKIARQLFDPRELERIAVGGMRKINLSELYGAALGRGVGAEGLTLGMVNGKSTTQNLLADTYALKKGLDGIGVPLKTINDGFYRATAGSTSLLTKVEALSNAFANMAQIGGDTFGGIAQGIGQAVSGIDAAMKAVDTIGTAFGSDTFKDSKGGKAMGAALVGMQMGSTFGAMAGSGGKGALAGAASGAATGAMVGGWMGAAVGAGVGAISGYFAGKKADKEARAAMDANRKELIAMYGSREELIKQAKRLGISEQEINKNILTNAKNAKAYSETFNKLADATSKEEQQAKQLAETLGKVAKVRGVIDQQQTKDLADSLKAGGGPRTEAAEAFLQSQRESLLQGLQGVLDTAGLTPALVGAVGDALPAAFAELRASGMSSVEALRALDPLLTSFKEKGVLAGLGSAEGFDVLNASLATLKDERLGPMVTQAEYASQSMAALQNLGWQTQATFDGFTSSITNAFGAIAADKGADQALRLLAQPLQNVWQLAEDFGYQVDEGTAALLAQAEAAGVVGDAMRPAADRAAAALDKVVDRLDDIIAIFKGDMVTGSQEGAADASKAILDTFAKVQPVIKVRYEYEYPNGEVMTPGDPTRGAQAARDATGGGDGTGDIYMDGERVGFVVGRHLGKVSDYAGA